MRVLILRLVIALLCLAAAPAFAARLEVRPSPSGAWIFIRGQLDLDDDKRFERLLAATPDAAVVALESDGGRLGAGIAIGTAIRARGLSTVVEEATQCASSCAIAWLGGARRYMGVNARIGFHAAYRIDTRRESGVGNALLGAYLNRLGLPDRAVAYITVAAPNQITWLSMADARALDIDVLPFTTTTVSQIPAVPRGGGTARGRLDREQLARDFLADYFVQSVEQPVIAQSYLRGIYAEDVNLNGMIQPRARVLEAHRQIAERWPERAYTIRPDSIRVDCPGGGAICRIVADVDWQWSSWGRGARASGRSRVAFQLSIDGDTPVVLAETQSVLSREVTGQ